MKRVTLPAIALYLLASTIRADVTLEASTSDQSLNTFIPGQEFVLKFRMPGLPADTKEVLTVNIVNEHGKTVRDYTIPIAAATNDDARVRFSADGDNGEPLWKVDVHPPTNRLGFFQVFAKLSSGVEIGPNGRLGNYIAYAIVPDPFLREQYTWDETFFGLMCARGNSRPLIGATVDLFNYQSHHWARFEPTHSGEFKDLLATKTNTPWEVIAPEVQLQSFNINGKNLNWRSYYLPFVFSPPEWASLPGTRAHMTASLTPEGEKAWADFCREFAAGYAKFYSNEAVQHFEMSTEPMFGWGFKGTSEDLVKVHQIAYEAMHAVNPKAKIGGPTFTGVGNGEDWGFVDAHREIFEKGIGKYIDVLHMHPYFGQPEESQFVQKIRAIKKIMRDTVGHEIPMAGTEGGYSYHGENTTNWLLKAWSDVRGNLIMLGEGFLFNIAFYGNGDSDPNNESWGFYAETTNGMAQMSPIPVVPAYAAMSFLLEGHRSAGAIEWLGDTAWGYAYQRGDDIVLAVWDWSGTPRDVEIPVGVDSVTVYDWMGNPSTVASPNGVVKLSLTKDPLYVKGVATALWSTNTVKAVSFGSTEVDVYPGATIEVPITCRSSGQLDIKPNTPVGLNGQTLDILIPENTATQLLVAITVPVSAAAGTYPVSAILSEAGAPRAAAGCMIRVQAPAEILYLRPTVTTNGPGLRVKLKAAVDVEGVLSANLVQGSEGVATQAVSLKAGLEGEYRFALTGNSIDPTRLYDAKSTMVTTEGSEVAMSKRLSFCKATRVDLPVKIDGNLDEWLSIEPIKIRAPDALRVPPGLLNETNDLAADVRFAWDTNALYLSFDVEDNVHDQTQTGWATWMCDCIQIGLNLDPEQVREGAMSTLEAGGMRRWQEIDIARGPQGPDVYRTMTYDNRFCPSGPLTVEQAQLATTRDEKTKHTIYEFALPWAGMSAVRSPVAGECISFACTINDRDGGGVDAFSGLLVMGLFNGIYGGKDIGQYGWVVLGE